MGANSSLCAGAYKPSPHHGNRQKQRKPAVRLGRLQRLVLLYASKCKRFTASDVVTAYSLKLRCAHANKRVHDAIQKLVKRGFLRKVDRGVYELVVDVSPDMLKVEDVESSMGEVKENLPPRSSLDRRSSLGLSAESVEVEGLGGPSGSTRWGSRATWSSTRASC